MDVAKLIERFATIHGRRPESKHELESSFAKYASSPDGWILIRKRMANRTGKTDADTIPRCPWSRRVTSSDREMDARNLQLRGQSAGETYDGRIISRKSVEHHCWSP